jgi:L-lactate dehydrogenase complex protein LldG
MQHRSTTSDARESILQSIRANLAASVPHDAIEHEIHHAAAQGRLAVPISSSGLSLVNLFKTSLEAVDGHCIVVCGELEVASTLGGILKRLQGTRLRARRIAISESAGLDDLLTRSGCEFDEVGVTPSASDVFRFDVGISRAQACIAETGTLLLDSSRERNRLVSLVPPVHIALVNASQIVGTLGEALSSLRQTEPVSAIVTLVTGPSRTADIELTLAIGVHGPQELYVIINEGE